ncbi:hypothetical protein [Bradyrhizobium sp. HKCCYLR20261]|uniref:hypothetical protein n=1 Tax=Bradyrhizobium sp. HKCCYLR20261 TaxID=3420760 RepID=UPI003EB99036
MGRFGTTNIVLVVMLLSMSVLSGMTHTQAGRLYPPDGCKAGFVWRQAYPGDRTCVTYDQRSRAANDNRQAPNRINYADRSNGPKACIPGYVWREAYAGDIVCVTPEQRARVKYDNEHANERRRVAAVTGS